MAKVKRYWEKTYPYQLILEFLEDYWITEPDEYKVRVRMDFIHASGQKQQKEICWENPNYTDDYESEDDYPDFVTFDISAPKIEQEDKWWNVLNIHKKGECNGRMS